MAGQATRSRMVEYWADNAEARAAVAEAGREHLIPLAERLLDDDGCAVMLPSIEEDLGRLMSRGRFFSSRAQRMPGRPNECWQNVVSVYENGAQADGWKIAVGYAMARDNYWRPHGWLVRYKSPNDQHPEKIETTAFYKRYFGYLLTDAEAERFVDENQG